MCILVSADSSAALAVAVTCQLNGKSCCDPRRSGFAASYGLEVAAIVAVLKQFPDDSKKAVSQVSCVPVQLTRRA
jgi:hypothetical protein